MREKKLLKIGTKNKGGVIRGIIISMALVGIGSMGVAAKGNIQDTKYYEYSTSGVFTETRHKWDDSSAYIRHEGACPINVQVMSGGINYSANGASYKVDVGQSRYLPNYVYERNQSDCYLFMRQEGSSAYYLYGVWSPDSV